MIPIITIMLIYSLIHSLLASNKAKQSVRDITGSRTYEGFYRLGYNVLASITFTPVLLLLAFTDHQTVWQLNTDWEILLLTVRITSLIAFSITLLQTDISRFTGLSQALAYIRHQPLPLTPEKLKTTGLYKHSRHPLYVLSILILWSTPNMTDTYLALCSSVTLYFIIGSRYEERRMLNTFGDTYANYRTQVPWLLPLPHKGKNG